MKNKTIILGGGSDIGYFLAKQYISEGYDVVATYRNKKDKEKLIDIGVCKAIYCDFSDFSSIDSLVNEFELLNYTWDQLISAIGTMLPIGKFLEIDFSKWEHNLKVNTFSQLYLLNKIWPCRVKNKIINVGFLAGGGTNNPFKNYSAYCISKIILIKMCELLDDENDDLNIFIVGPGYVKTKIHNETIENKVTAEDNYKKTIKFLESNGTELIDIHNSIKWCIENGKNIMSGRNLSTVHDSWKTGGNDLVTIKNINHTSI